MQYVPLRTGQTARPGAADHLSTEFGQSPRAVHLSSDHAVLSVTIAMGAGRIISTASGLPHFFPPPSLWLSVRHTPPTLSTFEVAWPVTYWPQVPDTANVGRVDAVHPDA
jgi:hypothetical protein